MAGQWKVVARLHFKGDRFRDHALDLTAVSELGQFQRMVAETAKSLWRSANPDRERLPKHFLDRTRLCLRTIEEGSVAAPLEVYLDDHEQEELWKPDAVEVNAAIDMAYRVFGAIYDDRPLPEEFPKSLLSEYARLGQGLSDDEALEFAAPGKPAARVTRKVRERLTALAEAPYEDHVAVVGHVLEADVRSKRFQLWLADGSSVQVAFNGEQEASVTTALKDHASVRLSVRGRGEYTTQGSLQRVTTIHELCLVRGEESDFDPDAPKIEDVLTELARDVPAEEWEKLPPGLTDNLDDYLYGTSEE